MRKRGFALLFILIAIALIWSLAGCGTPYQEMSFRGGVAANQITSDIFRISARGNAYTGRTTIQDYVLLKAAETTKSAGARYFVLTASENATRESLITTPGTATTSIVGSTAVTTVMPATSEIVIKPGQDVYIRVLRVAPGQAAPPGALDADELINFIGSRVRRES
ncbi:MAG: hypothetical protein WB820_15065 [Rhodoplanes sp.]